MFIHAAKFGQLRDFVLGIGAGRQAAEYGPYGYDVPPERSGVAQLYEALHVIKALSTEELATFAGAHYRVEGAECAPKPDPLPLIIGGTFRPTMGSDGYTARLFACMKLRFL